MQEFVLIAISLFNLTAPPVCYNASDEINR